MSDKWSNLQTEFSNAVRNPEMTPPKELSPLKGGTLATKRFNVYRNNVALSLINILKDTFPVTGELVGPDFFHTMAHHFCAQNLPVSPVMYLYGADFPAFIKQYQPASTVPYLSDIAALEWARNEAYYSADGKPITIEGLGSYQEDEIPNLIFTLQPSLKLIQSSWPVVTIWEAHQQADTKETLESLPSQEESALIVRPHLDVNLRAISASTACFISYLQKRTTFGGAIESAVQLDENFDIPANLAGLFSIGAVTAVGL